VSKAFENRRVTEGLRFEIAQRLRNGEALTPSDFRDLFSDHDLSPVSADAIGREMRSGFFRRLTHTRTRNIEYKGTMIFVDASLPEERVFEQITKVKKEIDEYLKLRRWYRKHL
jgi:hypothetical protein